MVRFGAVERAGRATPALVAAGSAMVAVHAWGLWNLGATPTPTLYSLYLLTLIPFAVIVVSSGTGFLSDLRVGLLVLVGLALFLQVWLQPTVAALGYVVASLSWVALFAALAVSVSGPSAQRTVVLVLLVLGALEGAIGLAQALSPDPDGAATSMAHGTLVNRNHFAGLMNLSLPLAIGAMYTGLARRSRGGHRSSEVLAWSWIGLLALAPMGLAVLLSRSRGGSLILGATLVFLAALLVARRRGTGSASLTPLVPSLLLVLVLAIGLVVGIGPLLERFSQTELSAEGRWKLYRETVGLVADHPVAGVGPGMYKWRFRPYQAEEGGVRFDHAHNDYLESAVEWGVPLALVLWSFLVWRLWRAVRVFLTSPRSWHSGLALGCAGSILSLLLHSLVDFNLYIPSVAMTFFAVVGLAWSLEPWRSSRTTGDRQ